MWRERHHHLFAGRKNRHRTSRRIDLAGGATHGHAYPPPLPYRNAGLCRRRELPPVHGRDRRRTHTGRVLHTRTQRPDMVVHSAGSERAEASRNTGAGTAGRRSARANRRAHTARSPNSGDWARRDWVWIAVPFSPARNTAGFPIFQPCGDGRSTWMPAFTATRCVRACREIQVNDVIGMAYRGHAREDRLRLRRSHGRVHLRCLWRVRAVLSRPAR